MNDGSEVTEIRRVSEVQRGWRFRRSSKCRSSCLWGCCGPTCKPDSSMRASEYDSLLQAERKGWIPIPCNNPDCVVGGTPASKNLRARVVDRGGISSEVSGGKRVRRVCGIGAEEVMRSRNRS